MILSINPTYLCNFRCDFCYLTENQLGDTHRIDLRVLNELLADISQHTTIDHVDLYGGEVGLLPELYFYELKRTIQQYYKSRINVVTNLARIPKFFLDDDITLSVSYDFYCRERSEQVFGNMIMIPKDIHVLVLASQCLIEQSVESMIIMLNASSNVKTVEIKPYSTNQANQHAVSHRDYEEFVKRWINSSVTKKFTFMNEEKIQSSLQAQYNTFSDDHIYITPQGQMAVLDFDLNDNEYFRTCETYGDYIEWTKKEKERVYNNAFCSKCPYLGHCLSEHLRDVKTLEHSCNGYRFLLDWYAKRT